MDTQCSDVIGYKGEYAHLYSWDSFTRNIKEPIWLGFSKREVEVITMNDDHVIIKCDEKIISQFLLTLCEATSIDFNYTKI